MDIGMCLALFEPQFPHPYIRKDNPYHTFFICQVQVWIQIRAEVPSPGGMQRHKGPAMVPQETFVVHKSPCLAFLVPRPFRYLC